VNLVALEMFANAIGPGKEIENVRGTFQIKKPERLLSRNLAAADYALAEFADPAVCRHVN
jgi:hypothetical protein